MDKLSIDHGKTLSAKWTLEKDQIIQSPKFTEKIQMERPKPKFENKVDEIIDTLEHDNDGPYFEEREVDYVDHMSKEIAKEIDMEITRDILKHIDSIAQGGK